MADEYQFLLDIKLFQGTNAGQGSEMSLREATAQTTAAAVQERSTAEVIASMAIEINQRAETEADFSPQRLPRLRFSDEGLEDEAPDADPDKTYAAYVFYCPTLFDNREQLTLAICRAAKYNCQIIRFATQEQLQDCFWKLYLQYYPGCHPSRNKESQNTLALYSNLTSGRLGDLLIRPCLSKRALLDHWAITRYSPQRIFDVKAMLKGNPAALSELTRSPVVFIEERTKAQKKLMNWESSEQRKEKRGQFANRGQDSEIQSEVSIPKAHPKKMMISLDLERDGLYGEFLSVGAHVFDPEAERLDLSEPKSTTFYAWRRYEKSRSADPSFVERHVLPQLNPFAEQMSGAAEQSEAEKLPRAWLNKLKENYFKEEKGQAEATVEMQVKEKTALFQQMCTESFISCGSQDDLAEAFIGFLDGLPEFIGGSHRPLQYEIMAETPFPVEHEFLKLCQGKIDALKINGERKILEGVMDLNSLAEGRQQLDRSQQKRVCAHNALADALAAATDWFLLVHKDRTYSYHSFVLPFRLKKKNEKEGDPKEEKTLLAYFTKALLETKDWQELNFDLLFPLRKEAKHNAETQPSEHEVQCLKLNYASYQYFSREARSAIWGEVSEEPSKENKISTKKKEAAKGCAPIVRELRYKPEEVRNKSRFIIERQLVNWPSEMDVDAVKRTNDEESFSLLLNAIRIKIYNTGVALLIFECENRLYPSLRSIKTINDIARRIKAPIIYTGEGLHPLSPSKLLLELPDKGAAKKIYGKHDDLNRSQNVAKGVQERDKIAKCIRQLLKPGLKGIELSYCEKTDLEILAAVEDRMFVCSLIRHDRFSDLIARKPKSAAGTQDARYCLYQQDEVLSDQLYALIFNDAGFSTCPNLQMRSDLIHKHLYRRWSAYGTVHAASHNSMLCLTSCDESLDEKVIAPFLTMYFEMGLLVLAQRLSILALSAQAAYLTLGLDQAGLQMANQAKIKAFAALQERYIVFKNQLLLFELTSQEQGVEYYQLLHESLYVKEEKEELDGQLNSLYEVISVIQSNRLSEKANVFAFVALGLALLASVYDRLDAYQEVFGCGYWGTFIVLVIFGILSAAIVLNKDKF